MKKFLITLLLFAHMNCIMGCTSKFVAIPYDEIDKTSSQSTLRVLAADSTEILFESRMYRFFNDTLEGTARINGEPQQIRLIKSEIKSIKILTNESQNLIAVLIISAGFTVLGYLLITSQIDIGL